MELEELKSLIRAAFKDVPYPGDDNIAGCGRSLTPIGCDDCDPLAAHFKGTSWQQHTPQTLEFWDSLILFFHAEALHYYLPAFMLADLDDPKGEWISEVFDKIQFAYSPGDENYEATYATKNAKLLSAPQRQAVIEYLRHVCEYDLDKQTLKVVKFLQTQ